MDKPFIGDRTFKGNDYTQNRLPQGEYENCIFEGCDFSDGYLDNQNFMECEFIDCNLSNVNLNHTIFKEVSFSHCKMVGLKFEDCNDFLMDFDFHHCTINLSSFYGLTLKKQQFKSCELIQVDFTETELPESTFDGCDLNGAIFERTNLEKADLRTAINYGIDPEKNQLTKAKFTKDGVIGLLQKYNIVVEDV